MVARPISAPGGLSCRELVELVTEYLEGTLTSRDSARFETHLASCEGCIAYLEQMRLTLRAVGHLRHEPIPAETHERLLDAFRGWSTARPR